MKRTGRLAIAASLLAASALCGCGGQEQQAKNTFVIYDQFLNIPALCFRLDEGWQGFGWINWSLRGDTKFEMSVIVASPSKHMLYQDSGPSYTDSVIFYPQVLALYQDPGAMAQNVAESINSSVVVPGLSGFSVVDAKWTQDVPEETRVIAGFMQSANSRVMAFGFEGNFECTYEGVQCDAVFTESLAVSMMPQVRPSMPAFGTVIRVNPKLVIAPKGQIREALRECGRQMATGFYNNLWCVQRDRTFAALVKGTIQGRNEGYASWLKTQEETSAMLDRVRKARSEQIREVKTVDNPLSPGNKIERPAFFENAWINGSRGQMLLSDQSLEPNIIRPLMEQGEWIAIE